MCTSGPERSPARVMWGKRSEMPLRIIGARAARPSGECPSWSTKPDHSETLCPPEQCPGGAFFHRTQRVMRFAVNGFLATTHAHVSAWWVANHKIYSRSRYSTHLRSIASQQTFHRICRAIHATRYLRYRVSRTAPG